MAATGRTGGCLLILAGLLSNSLACSTVALDDPPAEVNACRPSQMFFVSDVWPRFLSQTYSGKTCGDASCHDVGSGRLLRIVDPVSTTMPAFPLAVGSDWEVLYRSAAEQMFCSNALGSELFTRPAGLRTHGGGKMIEPTGPEGLLLEEWVSTKP
jgi:hypothetical protein